VKDLFRIRGFSPYIAMLFLNAFVDLGHKIVIQNTVFKIYDGTTQSALIAVVNALILLPFILLFSPAGFISNHYAKPRVMQIAAWAAVAVTLLITFCYSQGWFWAAFAMTLVLAAKSAIYSPAKYGYIREIAGTDNLAAANGAVQAITTIAILSGMFVFSWLFEMKLADHTDIKLPADMLRMMVPLGFLLVGNSVIELALAYKLPVFPKIDTEIPMLASNTEKKFSARDYFSLNYLRDNIRTLHVNRSIWLSIIGLSTYWGLAQALIAVFPTFAEERLQQHNTVAIQAMLACTGVGIMLGSVIAGRVSRHHIETGLIPIGAVGIASCIALLPFMHHTTPLIILMLAVGLSGGLFIIPLNALIQYHANPEKVGTVLAGNNWVQNVTMLAFLVITASASWIGLNSAHMFVLLTVVAIAGAGYTVLQLPQSFVRMLFSIFFRGAYRIDVSGFDKIPREGAVLLLGNHISWIDWAMVQIACPRPIHFVMQREIYNLWFLQPFLKVFGAIPIASGNSKSALQTINQLLKAGEVVCLFPEGAISRNGQLGEFRHGYERTVEEVNGYIVPFYLHGLWGSKLSRASSKLYENRTRGLKRNILVAFGDPLPITTQAQYLKQKVFELSIGAWQKQTDWLEPIPLAWLRTAKRKLRNVSVIDSNGTTLSNFRLLIAVLVFARRIKEKSRAQNVGLLLPTTSAGLICNMAALVAGKTVVNINYTASADAIQAALEKSAIHDVYSSRLFIKKLEQKGVDVENIFSGSHLIYLEDLKLSISTHEMVCTALASFLPSFWLYYIFGKPAHIDSPAAILFSSGSEGTPKGVVLSHRNIVANCLQVSDVLNTRADDVIMGSLPLFHSFGLTVTGFMPLLESVPVVCHPDPTDVLGTAKAIARHKATVLCGTSTFLRLYVRNHKIHPLMLQTLRVVVAGAEKLAPDVRDAFKLKFNCDVFEGYGATETTPVASVNIPDQLDDRYWHIQSGQKNGTVGLPLPGTAFRIVDPLTLATLPTNEDGLILIAGTQVMLGYLDDPEKTANVILELDGHRWYKTGDKGHLDADGFLVIVDRYSRFAKIAGEMISLTAVEEAVSKSLTAYDATYHDIELLAINIADERKGEKIVLLYASNLDEDVVRKILLSSDIQALMLPAEYIPVTAIPKLGSGKTDVACAKQIALRALE
jgi:acyl-[acyl-carrier-protein]-phospholipid O-acyltransferase/long-chain-fatty-acid--[acyl-carrier-protein] ligase